MFWSKLKKPIFMLAPMADVTDASFRRMIERFGKPDVMWTEFVSADGLVLAPEEGRKKLLADLMYSEGERPIVAQLFSSNPEHMESASRLCAELGFDGVDINMGCPDRSVEKQGAGAAMIKHPENALEVIEAAKRGAGGIPVSVKTRLGYNTDELEIWLPKLLAAGVAAITVHARTRKEMSNVPARWERIQRAVAIRDEVESSIPENERFEKRRGNQPFRQTNLVENQCPTLIFGNGDVINIADAKEKAVTTGADGVMLGRAIFGNPWLFSEHVPSVRERLEAMVEHTQLFEELLPHKNFAVMKKHYKAYVNGFDGAKELRTELMETSSADEVAGIINRFTNSAPSELLNSFVTL